MLFSVELYQNNVNLFSLRMLIPLKYSRIRKKDNNLDQKRKVLLSTFRLFFVAVIVSDIAIIFCHNNTDHLAAKKPELFRNVSWKNNRDKRYFCFWSRLLSFGEFANIS